MTPTQSFTSRISATLVVAILTACSDGGSPSFGPGVTAASGHETGLTSLSRQRVAALTTSRQARRPPPSQKLLSVSDWTTGDVFVFDYPQGTSRPTITTFVGDEPYGQCVDKHGKVFVADYTTGKSKSYLYGSTVVHHSFNPPAAITPAKAIGCSVDRWDDLAVAYYTSHGAANAYIAVWFGEVGAPTLYSLAACYYMWSPGHDHNGNLFVEGENAAMNAVSVCELPHAAAGMNAVTLVGVPAIASPGAVMWDGQYVALSDQMAGSLNETGLYQTTYAGGTAPTLTYHSSTILLDTCYANYTDVPQPFIVGMTNTPHTVNQGHSVVGGNLYCDIAGGQSRVETWPYPAGGFPSGNLQVGVGTKPYGQSVSFP